MFHLHLGRICILLLGGVFCWSVTSVWFAVLLRPLFPFRASVWLICPLSKVEVVVPNCCRSPLCLFSFVSFWLIHFEVLLVGACMFIIVVSSWWSKPFISIRYSSLFHNLLRYYWHMTYGSLGYTMSWFNTCICCKMISTIRLLIPPSPHNITCVC